MAVQTSFVVNICVIQRWPEEHHWRLVREILGEMPAHHIESAFMWSVGHARHNHKPDAKEMMAIGIEHWESHKLSLTILKPT